MHKTRRPILLAAKESKTETTRNEIKKEAEKEIKNRKKKGVERKGTKKKINPHRPLSSLKA